MPCVRFCRLPAAVAPVPVSPAARSDDEADHAAQRRARAAGRGHEGPVRLFARHARRPISAAADVGTSTRTAFEKDLNECIRPVTIERAVRASPSDGAARRRCAAALWRRGCRAARAAEAASRAERRRRWSIDEAMQLPRLATAAIAYYASGDTVPDAPQTGCRRRSTGLASGRRAARRRSCFVEQRSALPFTYIVDAAVRDAGIAGRAIEPTYTGDAAAAADAELGERRTPPVLRAGRRRRPQHRPTCRHRGRASAPADDSGRRRRRRRRRELRRRSPDAPTPEPGRPTPAPEPAPSRRGRDTGARHGRADAGTGDDDAGPAESAPMAAPAGGGVRTGADVRRRHGWHAAPVGGQSRPCPPAMSTDRSTPRHCLARRLA